MAGVSARVRGTYRIPHASIPSAIHKVGESHQEEREVWGRNTVDGRLRSVWPMTVLMGRQ